MKNYKYIGLLLLSLGLVSCDVNNELDKITDPVQAEVALNKNGLDFSSYIAVGASFTAGYTDGALFKAAQENSFPNILAKKFGVGATFTQPLMADNIGGMTFGGSTVIQEPRLYFNGAGPARLDATPTTEGTTVLPGGFNNYGIPGAKSFHLVATTGFGSLAGVPCKTANPYYARIATSASSSVLGDAMAQSPTFFTLSEVGGNDVLGFATSGGYNSVEEATDLCAAVPASNAIYQSDNTVSPADYNSNDITNVDVFDQVFRTMVTTLTAGGAKGVIATVPEITLLPFFTTVPNNALALDEATAASLTGFFQAVAGIFTQAAIAQGVPAEQAQALGAQYAITFTEGNNRWIIDVPVSLTNPLGFRQMTEKELLVLTIDQGALKSGYGSVLLTPTVLEVLGKLQAGTQITPTEGQLVLGAVNGLDDKDALDTDELLSIKTATDAYNATITDVASSNENVAVIDLNEILREASNGIQFDTYTMTTSLVTGGLVSLDGIHLTGRGYALMANRILGAIDAKFGSNFTTATNGLAKAGDYPTNFSPTLQ